MDQDTYMLYKCLMSSLTNEARKKVSIWSNQYRIGEAKNVSGVALLKVIIRESHLDTNATVNQIRTKLSSLDAYIVTIDADIGRFNQYVKLLIQSLKARNQESSDLLINLFKGYGAVSDEVFRSWLLRKQDDHEEGKEITPDELMQAAKNKYDTMVEKGVWNAPTVEEKIVALEAKLESTAKNLKKKIASEMANNRKKGAKPTSKKGGHRDKAKKKHTKSDDHPKDWPAPKPDEKKEAEHKGFKWYWCGKDTGGKCECWRAHKPSACKGIAPTEGKKRKKEDKGESGHAKKLRVAKAYLTKLKLSADNSDSDSATE